MNNSKSNRNKSGRTNSSTQSRQDIKRAAESKLQQTSLRLKRSVPLVDGKKIPQRGEKGHTNPDNHRQPTAINGNCSLHTGDGLLAIDIDDHNAFPDEIKSRLPDTFTTKTPHGGEHLLYHLPDDTDIGTADLPNDSGDLQYNGVYILCPGSHIDHSDCDANKEGCPGHGTGQYLPNNQPIVTITKSEHPDLLKWMRNLGNEENSKSASSVSKSPIPKQELNDIDLNNGESQAEWFYEFLHDEAGSAAREAIDDVLKGDDAGIIDSSDDSTIDRSKADYYALNRLYGAFYRHRRDKPPEARQNALDLFVRMVKKHPYHSDGQKRKVDTVSNPGRYLNDTIRSVQEEFDSGKWFRWFNWEYECESPELWRLNGPSRLTNATVLAAIRYLMWLGCDQPIKIESLRGRYRADFEQVTYQQAISQLSSYPPIRCSSPYPPGRITPPFDSTVHPEQVRTDGAGQEDERGIERVFPTRNEVEEMACLLNPEREPATFGDALSNLVNDPEPAETVVQAYCPYRKNGYCYIYYLQDSIAGRRDPRDARYVRLKDNKWQPTTREPY